MEYRGLAAKSAAIIGKEIWGLKVTSNFEQSSFAKSANTGKEKSNICHLEIL